MSDEKRYKVWTCKIIIDDIDLPPGFDEPPRMAAQEAIEAAGITVIANNSGWGGTLTESDKKWLKDNHKLNNVYYAGLMDTPEDNPH